MCHRSRSLPVAIPLVRSRQSEGVVELEYTLALAKATTLERGVHCSTHGVRSFPYPLGRGWVRDPHFEPGSHRACLHFSTPGDALRGKLSSYGSHRLITLASKSLYWDGSNDRGWCWHDGATLPVCCLACDAGDDASVLNTTEFWDEVRKRRGGDLGDGLYRDRATLPEDVVLDGLAPLDLEWLRKMRRLVLGLGGQGVVLARWAIDGWDGEVEVLLRRVAKGWWLENTYPIELWVGELGAPAILCEDEEHGVYFRVADRAFGRALTGEDRPVSLATPVAAQVVEYLERIPGRWALPTRSRLTPVRRRRFGEDGPTQQAPAIQRSADTVMPGGTGLRMPRTSRVSAA